MKDDVLNLPITALKMEDTSTVGTGIAIGAFSGLLEAAERMIKGGNAAGTCASMSAVNRAAAPCSP